MEKQEYQLSTNIHSILDSESGLAMVYHTLYGNPRIVNDEGLRFLDFFKQPATAEEVSKICDEDPRDTIQELAEIFFLVELGFDEKKFLREIGQLVKDAFPAVENSLDEVLSIARQLRESGFFWLHNG